MTLTQKEFENFKLMDTLIENTAGLTSFFANEIKNEFLKLIQAREDKEMSLKRKIAELEKELVFKDV